MTVFFTAGGTVPLDSPSYVERGADADLFAGLQRGELCYVLTTRQMGKSSLMARTARRLRNEDNFAVAVVDLTTTGNDLDRDQWYYGLLMQIGQGLGMRSQVKAFWQVDSELGLVQRWTDCLCRLLNGLPADHQLVIFIDEIDNVLALPFRVDEFFAAIRACYNRRHVDPIFQRLTFCLLGVAEPADLISNPRLTPFNIGRRIALGDFTRQEAAFLEHGLECDELLATALVDRIFYWTAGQPYLTQRLCQAIAVRRGLAAPIQVDSLCDTMFLSSRAREQDDNLTFVRDRLLKGDGTYPEKVALLRLYERVCHGRRVPDQKADPLVGALHLSGVVRNDSGMLRVRNAIYQRVFNRNWVRAHLPFAERDRERREHRRQLARVVTTWACGVVAVAGLARMAAIYKGEAEAQSSRAKAGLAQDRKLMYAYDMQQMQQAYHNGEFSRVIQLLYYQRPRNPQDEDLRGFEWRYYWYLMHKVGQPLIHGAQGEVTAVAFSPDGSTVASASRPGTIALWDPIGVRPEILLTHRPYRVAALVFCRLGGSASLAAACDDGRIRIWDITSHRELPGYVVGQPVVSVACSRNGRWIAGGTSGGQVVLLDAIRGYKWSELRCRGPVRALAFGADAGTLICGGTSLEPTRITTVPSLRTVGILRSSHRTGGLAAIVSLALSPDGKSVAAGRQDGKVDHWNIASRRLVFTIQHGDSGVTGLAFSPHGRRLATSGLDNRVRVWDVKVHRAIDPTLTSPNPATCIAFTPGGKLLACGSARELTAWERVPSDHAMNPVRYDAMFHHDADFAAVTFTPGGSACELRIGEGAHSFQILDIVSGRAIGEGAGLHGSCVVLASHGRTLAVGSRDGTVRLYSGVPWRLTGGFTVDSKLNVPTSVNHLAFSPNGRLVATATGDPAQVTVWDVSTKRAIANFAHPGRAEGVAFAPDGKWIAAASSDGFVYLWAIGSASHAKWWAHPAPVTDLGFSPDGHTLATCSTDHTVKLWNVATQREMARLRDAKTGLLSIAFSSDGTQLSVLCSNDQILVWIAGTLAQCDAAGAAHMIGR